MAYCHQVVCGIKPNIQIFGGCGGLAGRIQQRSTGEFAIGDAHDFIHDADSPLRDHLTASG